METHRERRPSEVLPDPWVQIRLTDDEAFVLSDWIYSLQGDAAGVGDEAVWPALYAIDGPFERSSPLIFARDYGDRLEDARARIRAGDISPGTGYRIDLTADQSVVLASGFRTACDVTRGRLGFVPTPRGPDHQ